MYVSVGIYGLFLFLLKPLSPMIGECDLAHRMSVGLFTTEIYVNCVRKEELERWV
tara:strand:+ start:141 stop:305 length:165 start_codon:yes stop_codon:yes gene_type:complete